MILSQKATLLLYKFKILLHATKPIRFFNFPDIALRGVFGWTLKLQTCLEKDRTSCNGCQFILDINKLLLIFRGNNGVLHW